MKPHTGHQAAAIIADLPKAAPKPPLGPNQLAWLRAEIDAFRDLEERTKRAANKQPRGKP